MDNVELVLFKKGSKEVIATGDASTGVTIPGLDGTTDFDEGTYEVLYRDKNDYQADSERVPVGALETTPTA